MGLMEQFVDPESFGNLFLWERFLGALFTAALGLGMTFAVLIILWGCIVLIKKFLHKDSASNTEDTAEKHSNVTTFEMGGRTVQIKPLVIGRKKKEVVAAIAGAVEAYESEDTTP